MNGFFLIECLSYADAVSTVQPVGIPLTPVTFQLAALFLTKVPVDATPETHLLV